jgi:hypothetical protein
MPYEPDNRLWLKEALGERIRPTWNREEQRWEIARQHLRTVVERLAERWGEVDVILEFREAERCDTRCRDAQGDDCVCSCLGDNHGGAAYWKNWIEMGDTTLVSSGVLQRTRRVIRR